MKVHVLAAVGLWLILAPTYAEAGESGSDRGAQLRPFGNLAKVFGTNAAFSAVCETTITSTSSTPAVTLSQKVAYWEGKWRIEFMIGETVAQMLPVGPQSNSPSMEPDESITNLSVIVVVRPDKKVVWRRTVYPGVTTADGYFEEPLKEPSAADLDVGVAVVELGTQTVDRHPCIINKFTFTDRRGKSEECTAWNATDLNRFPVRIERVEHGKTIIMLFKDITLSADASQFEPPGVKKYNFATLAVDLFRTISSVRRNRTNSTPR